MKELGFFLLALLAGVPTPVDAQSWLTWRRPNTLGPMHLDHAATYDVARNRIVLVGPHRRGAADLCETWEWTGAAWRLALVTSGPTARTGHAVAYDAARRKTILFGGRTKGRSLLADTWQWDGTTWTRLRPAAAPAPRAEHAMVWDSTARKILLFGGATKAGNVNDTWEWDGTNWSQRSPANVPSARKGHAMAEDPVRKRIVLFGLAADRTLEWDGTNWKDLTTASNPFPCGGVSMAFDPVRKRVLAHGANCQRQGRDTSEWTGTRWVRLAQNKGPLTYTGHVLVNDGRRIVWYGGVGGTYHTWEWNGFAWRRLVAPPSPTAALDVALSWDAARANTVTLVHATRARVETWSWDGSRWFEHKIATPQLGPSVAMVYDSQRAETLVQGSGQTWTFDGKTWKRRTPSTAPGSHGGPAMAFDPDRKVAVYFGGPGETWEWDGTGWTKRTPAVSPPARQLHAMAYDAKRKRVLLYGGAGPRADFWAWNGTNWTQLRPVGALPSARERHALVYDSARKRTVLYGGTEALGRRSNDTWEWNGTGWLKVATPMRPPAASATAAVYDAARRKVVLVGIEGLASVYEYCGGCAIAGPGHPVLGGLPIRCETLPRIGTVLRISFTPVQVSGPQLLLLAVSACLDPPARLAPVWACAPLNLYALPQLVLGAVGNPPTAVIPIPAAPALVGVSMCTQGISFGLAGCAHVTDGLSVTLLR